MKKFLKKLTGWLAVSLIGAGITGTGVFIVGTFLGLEKVAVWGFVAAIGSLCSAGACKDLFMDELQSIAEGKDGDKK